MVDTSPMCVCPCNPASTRSQSTALPYHSTSENLTSSTLEQSFYIFATTSTKKTSASASLSSSDCYCPCSTTSSTSYLLCKYSYRNKLAYSQNFLEKWNQKNALCCHPKGNVPVNRYFPKIVFSSFPASENIMANFTESISPSTTDSIVSSQLGKISASLSLTPSPPLSLATSASAFAELTIQSDFVSSSFSSYLSQDASSSVSKSLTFFRRVSRFSFKK